MTPVAQCADSYTLKGNQEPFPMSPGSFHIPLSHWEVVWGVCTPPCSFLKEYCLMSLLGLGCTLLARKSPVDALGHAECFSQLRDG